MAIDTKEKRAAIFGVARPWNRDKLPVGTTSSFEFLLRNDTDSLLLRDSASKLLLRFDSGATLDEEWRIASGNAYGGNALSPPVGTNRLLLINPIEYDGEL